MRYGTVASAAVARQAGRLDGIHQVNFEASRLRLDRIKQLSR